MSAAEPAGPETLPELLAALEKSGNLRALARECGLTVKDLRRRLVTWRRELLQEAAIPPGGAGPTAVAATREETRANAALRDSLAGLPRAAALRASPLPAGGDGTLEIWTDGACRGNPGPSAIGVLFRRPGGPDLCVHGEAIGRATNNAAEYRAVLRALEFARAWDVRRIDLFLDSELIARQLSGVYRVKSLDLRPLYQQVLFLARGLDGFRVRHIPRERNAAADLLANEALDAEAAAG
ncbi:MAG: ribonuclease HI family protein [Candidatus Krumholzibacteriia bacterium]